MRYYVESKDQYGILEVDAFDTLEAARKLARQMVRDGAPWADVVDRQECVLIERVEA